MTLSVDTLAQEIRRVDGNNDKGAGALAEALMPFIRSALEASAPVKALDRPVLCGCMAGPNDPDPQCEACGGSGQPRLALERWRPISTADKGAASLMLGIVRKGALEEIHIGGYRYAYNDDEVSCWWSDQADDEVCPTHWAPLPPSPLPASAPVKGETEGWRPISTVKPVDGLIVLGYGEYRERDGFSPAFMRWYDSVKGWSVNSMTFYPTHWRPLPASPEQGETE